MDGQMGGDEARYRIGNAVPVPIVEWIGKSEAIRVLADLPFGGVHLTRALFGGRALITLVILISLAGESNKCAYSIARRR